MVSQLEFHGLEPAQNLIEVRAADWRGRILRTEDVIERIAREGPRLALVLLPGVQSLTGQLLDMPALIGARAPCRRQCQGVDLALAIGNTPLHFDDWNPDFAVWCSYKYSNAGPGAVGGCFVHGAPCAEFPAAPFCRLGGDTTRRSGFSTIPNSIRSPELKAGNSAISPIMSTAPLLAALDIFQQAGPARIAR